VPRYTHYDGRGDVVLQTGSGGQSIFEAAYEAFGTRTRESGRTPDRQRANTKEEETTFQLLNEGHRYRDLETGVWLTRDPAGFVDGPNLYAYVRQNPWSKFDPDGLAKKWLNEKPDYVAGFERRIEALPIHWSKKLELLDRVRVYNEADSKKFAKRVRHEIDTSLSGYEERAEDDRKTVAFFEEATALVPIPQSNADLGVMVAGGPAVKAAGKYLKKGFAWVQKQMARGKKSEERILKDIGEAKNTTTHSTSHGNTIPDFENDTRVGDIKDTKELYDTAQMKAQRELAEKTGREHVVITGQHTKVSEPLEKSGTIIERRPDLGPKKPQ
jgi:RHS repeat-associated protein